MKELSIEEKAKRYDETIEQLRKMMPNWDKLSYNGKTFLQDLVYIIPELKESEDERIRKAIINEISLLEKESVVEQRKNVYQSWIAWLEKQGESYTKRDIDNAYIEGMAFAKDELDKQVGTNVFDVPKISIKDAVEVTSRMQYIEDDMKPIAEFIMDYAHWDLHKDEWNQPTLTVPLFRVLDALIQRGKPYCECSQNSEKQSEQKPFDYENANIQQGDWAEIPFGAKDSELQEVSYHIPEGFHAEIGGNRVIIKKGEQKPAWTKEDDVRLQACIDVLQAKSLMGKVDTKQTQWLASLKDRVQPKQEWSEEDSVMINKLLAVVDLYYNRSGDDLDKQSCISFLKSLRPQNRWKPNDEQMTALRRVKAAVGGEGLLYNPLNSLYEQLKKLKGE